MIVTAELSLYPLQSEFEKEIISFIQSLKSTAGLEVYTHSMSTYVIGDSKQVFGAIQKAFENIDASVDTSSLIVKMVNRRLPVEKGFLNF